MALDNVYFSEDNIQACQIQGIEPYIATDHEPHHLDWHIFFTEQPQEPAEDVSPKLRMANMLRTEIGQAIYHLRECTVEPVIGIIQEVLGFRQFSLRELKTAA